MIRDSENNKVGSGKRCKKESPTVIPCKGEGVVKRSYAPRRSGRYVKGIVE